MDLWGEIGTASGKIYSVCVGQAPVTMLDLKKRTKLDDPMLYLALGWLAREGKAQIASDKGVVKVKVNP